LSHVLITRPQPEAAELRDRLTALGRTSLIDPLLSVEHLDPSLDRQAPYQAIMVTSGNALRALARHPDRLAWAITRPLFAVGPATAALGKSLGFSRVIQGPGTAAELADTIRAQLRPDGGPLLNLTGEITAFDLVAALRPMGYAVDSMVMYRMVAAQALMPGTITRLTRGDIGAVIVLSKRTVETYVALIEKHNILEYITNIPHLCLSGTIADALRPLGPVPVLVPAHPNIEELLALVGGAAKSLP
jgi:uroporphyrinogen-III synthase